MRVAAKLLAVASLVIASSCSYPLKIVIYNKDTVDLTEQVIKEFDRVNK